VAAFKGGTVYAAEFGGRFYLILNENTLWDVFDDDLGNR